MDLGLYQAAPINRDGLYVAGQPNKEAAYMAAIGAGGRTYSDDEQSIVHTYIAEAWEDSAELRFMPGDLLFATKERTNQSKRNTIANLAKLNQTFRLGHDLVLRFSGRHGRIGDATDPLTGVDGTSGRDFSAQSVREYIEKSAYMRDNGLDPWERPTAMQALMRNNARLSQYVEEMQDFTASLHESAPEDAPFPETKEYLREIRGHQETRVRAFRTELELMSKHALTFARYASVEGVMASWNFLGVLRNTGSGKALQSYGSVGSYESAVLNVVLQRRCEVTNFWGSVTDSSDLYVAVERRLADNGDPQELQAVPIFSNTPGVPPARRLTVDLDNRVVHAGEWYIGHARYLPRYAVAPDASRLLAAGLMVSNTFPSLEVAWERRAQLHTVDINLRNP